MTLHPGLPLERGACPFDPPPALRGRPAVEPLTYPDGTEGWLVTGYDEARAVLADRRVSARAELARVPFDLGPMPAPKPADPGVFTGMDDPQHHEYRKLLTGAFTVRRMRLLETRVTEIVEEHLAAMAAAGPPVDLVTAFARPVPALVICELLGAPYDRRNEFQAYAAKMFAAGTEVSMDERLAAVTGVVTFIAEQIRAKRAEPTDDLLSDLVAEGSLNDEELANIGMMLLVAGFETTRNMLALGTYALLENPEQLARLEAYPSLAANAVEELMRYLSVIHIGPIRTALEDLEVGGRTIKAGDSITISVPMANRDPKRYPEPDVLDLGRKAIGHVGFGHGVHQCLGQQLARVEMRIALAGLFARFPDLRLAVPAAEIVLPEHASIYGPVGLPVAWG
ncbi:cytochrome P450 [Amycolatopsis jiangsuensis]|uniref:Cytochrome P450 n=1 Tax=Amycolatopsis jiangsuensis TaxID=1181879 RepID=A0A840J5I6_9PSEU|nr:cytochrome P450 [Amycolatopsis jiangsuensis]MBB4688687.1 cytochrome P450 [Amycolatopsis jiangsuensis]